MSEILNQLDIDNIIQSYIKTYKPGIITLYKKHFHNSTQTAIDAFMLGIIEELKTACISFLNKDPSGTGLYQYLFYVTNSCAKKAASSNMKKATGYLCPGCLSFGKQTQVKDSPIMICYECKASLNESHDPSSIYLFDVFSKHNKKGYRCPECNRFIPHPLNDKITDITCPYLDCCYVGDISILKKMQHPNYHYNLEDLKEDIIIDNNKSNVEDQLNNVISKEDYENKKSILTEIIDSQYNSAAYSGSDFTLAHKYAVYKAFKFLIEKYNVDMIEYLLDNSRSGGFQHKIFQEYIRFLEESLPICFKKRGIVYRVDSLLDQNLNLFEGISVFDSIVNEKLEIKNETKEIYIGGRKAAYAKPYYIGKLLSIIDKNTKKSIIEAVVEYSFSKIKLSDIKPGTEVIVSHLRIPPHYQMGGMVHINRIRKKIVEKAIKVINSKENEK